MCIRNSRERALAAWNGFSDQESSQGLLDHRDAALAGSRGTRGPGTTCTPDPSIEPNWLLKLEQSWWGCSLLRVLHGCQPIQQSSIINSQQHAPASLGEPTPICCALRLCDAFAVGCFTLKQRRQLRLPQTGTGETKFREGSFVEVSK